MNEYDSNRILDLTKNINYNLTDNITEADCYVLNTCHIREKATDKVYHDIGRVKKKFVRHNISSTNVRRSGGCVGHQDEASRGDQVAVRRPRLLVIPNGPRHQNVSALGQMARTPVVQNSVGSMREPRA